MWNISPTFGYTLLGADATKIIMYKQVETDKNAVLFVMCSNFVGGIGQYATMAARLLFNFKIFIYKENIMSKEMREQIDRVKNWKQFMNEGFFNSDNDRELWIRLNAERQILFDKIVMTKKLVNLTQTL